MLMTSLRLNCRPGMTATNLYRLDIVNPSCEDVLDPDLWAQGLVVRRFFTRRQTSDGQTAATADIRPISGHDTRN